MPKRFAFVAAAVLALGILAPLARPDGGANTFTNPLTLSAEGVGPVTTCADPTILRDELDGAWVMICTSDPLSGDDRDETGALRFRLLPTFTSDDLVSWTYVGDALAARPSWAEPSAGLWAPDLVRKPDGGYLLYFAVTDVRTSAGGEPGCASDSAIGVATATSPLGPWSVQGAPIVRPRRLGPGCAFASTIDPEAFWDDEGGGHLLFGGYAGGIAGRLLSPDGLVAPATTEIALASERYEGAELHARGEWIYLFASPNGCCNGDLTGYTTLVGRAATPRGPFIDRDAVDLSAGRSGGTMALAPNGNRFVGPGHVEVFEDRDATTWIAYHAIERDAPFLAGEPGFTRRPVLLDPIVWSEDGWPTTRGGWGPGACAQSNPAARDGETSSEPILHRRDDALGAVRPEFSDDFADGLDDAWSWIREPPSGSWRVEASELVLDTNAGELFEDADDASVLIRDAPPGSFAVEVELRFDVPAEGCCHDFAQAGLVLYGDDDRYLKLVHVAIGSTRQTEFGKEVPPRGAGWPRYGGSSVGPPGDVSMLRVVRRIEGAEETYTAYTRADAGTWRRGGTWTHTLGSAAKIGVVAMNRAGYTARFDRVTVHDVLPYPCDDPQAADPCRDAPPGEVTGLRFVDEARLSWPAALGATAYDVLRGTVSRLSVGDYGECVANDTPETSFADVEVPGGASAFTYLVRGADPTCGWAGPWGSQRTNDNPATCP